MDSAAIAAPFTPDYRRQSPAHRISHVARRAAIVSSLVWSGNGPSALAPAALELASPPVLRNISSVPGTAEFNLTAAPTRLSIIPGKTTEVFAYNGSSPGPTIEVNEGDRVIVHFRNDLPEPTTVHWHGIHLAANQDGSPFDPVAVGGRRDYVFTVPRGTAGTYWYHPHFSDRTNYQVAKGLVGALIVRAPDDPLAGTIPEKLLILTDNRFRPDGSVDLPQPHSPQALVDDENGREGNVLMVNGQVMPHITLRRGELQRWRIVNASTARVYRLAIPGRTFLHVGSDGGLFERAREVSELLLANSERAEILVRGAGQPGSRAVLQSLPYDRYAPPTRPKDWQQPLTLLTVQTAGVAPAAPAIPATLRQVPPIDTTRVAQRRVIVLGQGMINNRQMDMNRVDLVSRLGTTEIWEVQNVVGMDHPFHLHGFRFQILDRNGTPEPYRSWKDVVNVPRHEKLRLVVQFEDFPGKWMFHCHIMTHEDQGMMGILEVRP